MNETYDLVIFGSGLQASLLLAEAACKGLKVALIADGDCAEGLEQSPVIVEPDLDHSLNHLLSHHQLIQSLKKSFPHLFIDTQSDFYGEIGTIQRFKLLSYNLLSQFKITYHSHEGIFKYPYLSYNCHKYSGVRMSLALVKEAVKSGAKVYQHSKINFSGYDQDQYLQVQLTHKNSNRTINLRSKNILSFYLNYQRNYINFNELANKTQNYFFTYPISKLNIQKNLIYKNETECLYIIPWFDVFYVQYSNPKQGYMTLDDMLGLINDKLKEIKLERSQVLFYGNYYSCNYQENKDKIQLIYFNEKKQFNFKYKPVNQWFEYFNQICNRLLKQLKKGRPGPSIIGKMVFTGGDLPKTSNPLRLMEFVDEKYDQVKQILKSPIIFKKLFYAYGSEIDRIIEKAYEYRNETKNNDEAWMAAEMWYAVTYELCDNIEDFVNNRSVLAKGKAYSQENDIAEIISKVVSKNEKY